MVYAPFGTAQGKAVWDSAEDYFRDYNAFFNEQKAKGKNVKEIQAIWFSRPEHMGPKGYRIFLRNKGRRGRGAGRSGKRGSKQRKETAIRRRLTP